MKRVIIKFLSILSLLFIFCNFICSIQKNTCNLNGNDNLTKIINKTNNSFAWDNILDGKYSDDYNFVTGTVVNSYGNVEVVSE